MMHAVSLILQSVYYGDPGLGVAGIAWCLHKLALASSTPDLRGMMFGFIGFSVRSAAWDIGDAGVARATEVIKPKHQPQAISGAALSEAELSAQFVSAYDQYADAIYRHCRFRVFNRDRAEDLMQETFKKTWQYLIDGKSIENLRAFLYRVASNLIVDELRRRKELSLDLLEENGVTLASTDHERLLETIEVQEFIDLLSHLNDRYRTMIVLRYINDLQPEEIARVTGETPNVVSVCLYRALRQIRKLHAHESVA